MNFNKKKIKILVTLGPSSLTKDFLIFAKKKPISFLRLNMSHIKTNKLPKIIKYIRKFNTKTPICLDTEGAQIRTKISKRVYLTKGKKFKLNKKKNSLNLYPSDIYDKLKVGDILLIGFENLEAKVTKIKSNSIELKAISAGFLEGNKGVHLKNRNIKLNYLTNKDIQAIKIAKKFKITNFALSFTNSSEDIKNFKKIIEKNNKIYKLETFNAIKNIKNIAKEGSNFLIDRGDLSKETNIEKIPMYQRKIINEIKKFKKNEIYIATNLLESMIKNNYPTRAEANDIYNCLELGASGLVLAAETAIGKHPKESVNFLIKMINEYLNFKEKKKFNIV